MKKNWFSWGWVIFWLIMFWPAVFIYLFIKYGDAHNDTNKINR